MKNGSQRKKKRRFRCVVDKSSREQLLKLWLTHGPGLSATEIAKDRLRLDEIVIAPGAFQPREHGEDYRIKDHIEDLTRTAEQQVEMDAITLFAIAGRRYVLNGHLRAEAYSRAGTEFVPVCHFQGTFHEARFKSVSDNAKAQLSLNRQQRIENAWEIVKDSETALRLHGEDALKRLTSAECHALGYYSKKDICKGIGIADGTVANMRRVVKDKALGFSPRALTWAKVLEKLRPDACSEYSEEKRQAKLQRWTVGFRRTTGKAGDKDPETAAEAFEAAHPLAAAILRDQGQADAEDESCSDTLSNPFKSNGL